MASGSNIGIMDEAYFVGRKAILHWINTTFDLNVAKIEDTASGAVACQIAEAVFPGKLPMQKVKWDARSDYEFVGNYKLLQQCFGRNAVDKHVEVEKLCRAKYQDNLEFMQWMKRFYELNAAEDPDYDPVARRARGKGAPGSCGNAGAGAAPAPERKRPARARPAKAAAAPARGGTKPAAAPAAKGGARRVAGGGQARDGSLAAGKRIEELSTQVTELRLSVDGLEKERDFYFGKLRDIEILLQAYDGPDKALADSIFKILYATEDDFVAVDGDEAEEPVEAETKEVEV